MNVFMDTLNKLRGIQAENTPVEDLAQYEAFARFMAQPFYETFLQDLERKALHEGMGLTDGQALLKAQGSREAYLSIINDLRRRERITRERLAADRDNDDE